MAPALPVCRCAYFGSNCTVAEVLAPSDVVNVNVITGGTGTFAPTSDFGSYLTRRCTNPASRS